MRQIVSLRRGYQDTFFITSHTDQRLVCAKEIVAQYMRRWNVETDFRSLKCALDAGILSCQSADMIKKERKRQRYDIFHSDFRTANMSSSTHRRARPLCKNEQHIYPVVTLINVFSGNDTSGNKHVAS